MKLYELTQQYMELEEVINEHAAEGAGAVDEELFNHFRFISEQIEQKAENCVKVCKNIEAECAELDGIIDGFKKEIARLADRKKALENGSERLKDYLLGSMIATGKEKIKTTLFTIYKTQSKSVSVLDEGKIPDEYFRIKKEVNKKSIGDELKMGKDIPGCELVTNTKLQVR